MAEKEEENTIRDFMESLMKKTKVTEAEEWRKKIAERIPAWETYLNNAMTADSFMSIASVFCHQVTVHVRHIFYKEEKKELAHEMAEKGRVFLGELVAEAEAIGIKVDLKTIDHIHEPMAHAKY